MVKVRYEKVDWEPHRELIHRLYVVEKKSLNHVIEYMRDERDFKSR